MNNWLVHLTCRLISLVNDNDVGNIKEKQVFKGFLQYMYIGRAAIWSCDPDTVYKLSFPLPTEASYEIWLCFVCVEVLWPSKPNGVMLNVVSLVVYLTTLLLGRLSPLSS